MMQTSYVLRFSMICTALELYPSGDVLLISRSRRSVLYAPALALAGSAAATVFFLMALIDPQGTRPVIGNLLGLAVFAGITWLFAADVAMVSVEGDRLVLRSLGSRRSVLTAAARIAVLFKPGGRFPKFGLMLTDGEAMAELGEWTTERAAERTAARIEAAFGLDDGAPARKKAARHVETMELRWRKEVESGQRVIDAYYQSPAWRRAKYGVPLLVLLYLIGMGIYIRVWGS